MPPLYSLPAPAGYRANPTNTLLLDSRSPYLLQGTAPGTEGVQQAFPNTAVDLITSLGATGVIAPASVLAIYQCDTASPLVDSLGLGPNLVAAGGPLTGRECVGLPTATFNSKVGVEFPVAGVGNGFRSAISAFDANVSIVSWLVIARVVADGSLLQKRAVVGYAVLQFVGAVQLYALGTGSTQFATVANQPDASWHSFGFVIDDVARTASIFSDLGDNVSPAYAGTVTNANIFSLGYDGAHNAEGRWQIAYAACLDVAVTSAQRATFWRAFNPAGLGTDPTYTRANPLVARITNVLGNVACYGANQLPTAYAANASAGDNALKTAVVCEDGATFLGLGTDNMPAYVGTNAAVTATDGPSGMRDACRVADTDAVNAGYATSGAAVLAGATNVSFVYAAYVKSGGVGANAVFQSYYTGDGGGPETFTNWTIAGAVGAVWRPFAGLAHTPVGAAHTAVVTRLIPTDNVGASLGTVDFAEVWGVQNSALARLAWRRVATGAAAATGTATLSYTNLLNARYSPARGRIRLRISDFAGTNGATFLCFGVPAAAGALVLDYSGGALRLRIWDDVAALVGTATCGAVSTANHEYIIEWDAAVGRAAVLEGATVLGSFAVVWVPEPNAITPIYVGTDNASANAARCQITCLFGYNY